MAHSFVKAIHDYNSSETGDLAFKAGAIIEVLTYIDNNWIKGELNGQVGLFPATFVESISVVSDPQERTVVAKETYISGEEGVLTFFRGDVVTCLGSVDDHWCLGRFGGEVGLFSRSTVDGLEKQPSSTTCAENKVAEVQETRNLTSNSDSLPVDNEESCAETLFEFKGLSDTELSFPSGEIILLTRDIDEHWFKGSFNGRTGLLPKNFVNVLVPLPESFSPDVTEEAVPHAIAIYPFVGETSLELSFREGEVIILDHWVSSEWIQGNCNGVTGIFPSCFVEIQVDLPKTFEESVTPEANLDNGNEYLPTDQESLFKVGDRALAIYSFASEIQGDLSLEVGDLISIKGIIDNEWVVGQKNGSKAGLCPAVFLEPCEGQLGLETKVEEGVTFHSVNEQLVSTNAELGTSPDNRNISDELNLIRENQSTLTIGNEVDLINGEGNSPFLNGVSDPYQQVSTFEIADNINRTKPNLPTSHIVSEGTPTISSQKQVSAKPQLSEQLAPRPPLAPKPDFIHKPAIAPKPEFLKSSALPRRTTDPNREVIASQGHDVNGDGRENILGAANVIPYSHPRIPPRRRETVTSELNQVSNKVKDNFYTQDDSLVTNQRNLNSDTNSESVDSGWIKFDDEKKFHSHGNVNNFNSLPKPSPTHTLNSIDSSPSMTLEESFSLSYKSLLDKSLDDDLPSPLHPEGPNNRIPPVPPPRLDLLANRPSVSVSSDDLLGRQQEQAEEFENSYQARKNSPSLNELRAASQKSMNGRPVPARRTKLPNQSSGNGFPVLNDLSEQRTRLVNELEKETKVIIGVDALIQMVDKNTSRKEELESKKGVTERKITDLKRQLQATEDKEKYFNKLLAGYTSQEDIKLKIEQLQDSIKENIETRDNLQSVLTENKDEETAKDLQENILLCSEAIKNLKSELDSLRDVLGQLEGGTSEKTHQMEKDVTLRKKVIDEILNTEKSFGSDLNLCVNHYMKQLIKWKVEAVDCDLLFGNMPEVAALSGRLLNKLEAATSHTDINHQLIGNCFVDFSEEITAVYGKYCRNHDDAIAFLEKSANDDEIQQYLKKCWESIREYSNCWDLSSFLIKPVQRILKYPLLLNELLKNTPDNHPDRTGLIKAIEVMTRAASDVNEFKRRKDLVQKYQRAEESGLSTKIQKFTWHSLVKKSTRFNQRITQFTGLVSQTVDEKFNKREKVFYQIEKTLKNCVKNTAQYMEQFEEVLANQVQTAENIVDFYQENASVKEVQEYLAAQKYIGDNLLNEMKHNLDTEVLEPLNSLLQLFQGPHRLIQKRHDKCLDYDSWANKIDKIKDHDKRKQAKEELEIAKKNYEALNAQLLDDLPILNTKALIIVRACITNFAKIHKTFFVQALDQFSPSLQLSAVNSESSDISDFFTQSKLAIHEVFQLSFTPKKTSLGVKPIRPNISPVGKANLSPDEKYLKTKSLKRSASDSKRKAPLPRSDSGGIVRSQTVSVGSSMSKNTEETKSGVNPKITFGAPRRYSERSTYIAEFTFKAEGRAEISVNKGDIVTVLEYHDSFGNSEWWKVERAGESGYVPSSFLAAQSGTSGETSNGSIVDSNADYVARYDFMAGGPSEVSVRTGDVVTVLQRHDPSGNREWWLVKANRRQGFVPESYLVKR